MKIDIEMLWKEMEEMQGYVFYTINGLPFTIKKKNENCFDVYRGDKKLIPIKKTDMKFIINNPNVERHIYRDNMRCASYALAVYSKLCEGK